MLWPAIGDLLPAAAAIALSPFPIVAVVVVLGTARARANGLAFAAGWTGGLAVLTAIATAITSGASDPDSAPSTAVGVVRVVVGLVFLGLAVKTWRGRPRPGEDIPMPGWMASLDGAAPGRTLVLGAALSGLNPKIMALAISGATSIGQAGLDPTEATLAAAAFVAIGSSTVLIAVGAHLLAAERAAGPLAAVKRFMIDHNTAIMLVLLVVLGANILGEGVANLTD
jgi:threonine/homoserine/homoserine lactone efflux protein